MDADPSRKRLRRNTRSCYQCRKRKVKCQLTEEDVQSCAECIKTGTRCTLQPPKTDIAGPGGFSNDTDRELQDATTNNNARLERIEALLAKLVNSSQQQEQPLDHFVKHGAEPVIPATLWDDFLLQPPVPEDSPPSLIHDNSGLRRQDSSYPGDLLMFLPSPQDALTIASSSNASLWGAESPPGSVLTPGDALLLLDTAAISRGTVMHIAKVLALFALYMQQLPAAFQLPSFESQDLEQTVSSIASRIRTLLVTHEEDACSPDGLECLLLLSQLHLNNYALRKAWMSFRTTLDIGRLAELPASFFLASRNSPCPTTALCRRLWLSAVCGDSYCSLLLGLEPGLGVSPFGPDADTWADPVADDDSNVQRRICLIVARIAQRNAAGMHRDQDTLRELDEALVRLRTSLATTWWKAPAFRSDRSLESAKEPNRLICQLWFYQAQALLHLPVAFAEDMEESVASLEICMEAARITLHRYLGLRHAREQLSRCRAVEQSASLAAAILVLAVFQLRHRKVRPLASRFDSDYALLEQIIEALEDQGKLGSRERVARRSSELLSVMARMADAEIDGSIGSHGSAMESSDRDGASVNDSELFNIGLGDIVKSSILPALPPNSPASRLITQTFSTGCSKMEASRSFEEESFEIRQ